MSRPTAPSDGALFASQVLERLIAMRPDDRIAFLDVLRHNDVFCQHCGYGSRERPNPDCRCWDDS